MVRTAALLLALSMLLTAASAAEVVLRAKVHAPLETLDPIASSALIVRNHGFLVYDTLFGVDAEGVVRPQMLESWEASADGLTYTFRLRERLRFHDGAPVTAADCVASLRRWGRRDGLGQRLMDATASLQALDERSFRLVLREPFGLVLQALAKTAPNAPFIMPQRLAEADPFQPVREAVGSGPFVFDRAAWAADGRMLYRKNKSYEPRLEPPSGTAGAKAVYIDVLEWLHMPDQNSALKALLAGRIDYFEDPAPDLLAELEAAESVSVRFDGRTRRQGWLRVNHLLPPFDDVRARWALQYLVDQRQYLEAAVGPEPRLYRVCLAMFGCDTPLASEVGAERIASHDLAKARSLLAAAGYDGRPIVLLRPVALVDLAAFSDVTARLLRQADVNVQVQEMDWLMLRARRSLTAPPEDGGWHLFHTTWSLPEVANPAVHLGTSGGCAEAWFGWPCDAELEGLRRAFIGERDPGRQRALAHAVQARANEVVSYIPLGELYGPVAYRSGLRGLLQAPAPLFWNVRK